MAEGAVGNSSRCASSAESHAKFQESAKEAKKERARTGEFERAAEGALGVVVAADADERDGVVEQAAPVVGADLQHTLVVGDGPLELSALPLQVAQVEQRLTRQQSKILGQASFKPIFRSQISMEIHNKPWRSWEW